MTDGRGERHVNFRTREKVKRKYIDIGQGGKGRRDNHWEVQGKRKKLLC